MPLYTLEGKSPTMPEGFCWIAPTANVIGQVTLGEECGVWFGTTIRGDNEPIVIGNRTNIQENCVLHTDPGFPIQIADGCTIGHKAMVHGCKIGANTLIGMGATLLNGAKIGENCLIGAGSLIPEGKEIPDNALVIGSPGKIIRTLDAAAAAGIARSADVYVANARRFAAGLATA